MEIGLRRTRVRNSDGVVVDYPNRLLANTVIVNFSKEPTPVRVRFPFHVDYAADLEQVVELALEIIEANPDTIPSSGAVVVKSIWSRDQGLLSAGVLLEGRFRVENVRDRTVTRSAILRDLMRAFKAHGVPLLSLPPTRAPHTE